MLYTQEFWIGFFVTLGFIWFVTSLGKFIAWLIDNIK